MDEIKFNFFGDPSTIKLLYLPINFIEISVSKNIGPRSITIWNNAGTAMEIFEEMHDIGFREEVGTLGFRVQNPLKEINKQSSRFEETVTFDLSSDFEEIEKVEAVFCSYGEVKLIENGIIITSKSQKSLKILAGAFPHSLAIQGVDCLETKFSPDFELAQCELRTLVV